MLIFFALSLASLVATLPLDRVDPYASDPAMKDRLHFGCGYLANSNAMGYETDGAQERVKHAYNNACLQAIWPGHARHPLPKGNEVAYVSGMSFKKGYTLTFRDNRPSLIAPNDGHSYYPIDGEPHFIYYARDKPPMKLGALKKITWPQEKDVLAFKSSQIKKYAMISRNGRHHASDAMILLDRSRRKRSTLANFKTWLQTFQLDKYDAAEFQRLRVTLGKDYPDVYAFAILKNDSTTHIVPFHRPFTLIPPESRIAYKYNPDFFEFGSNLTHPLHSIIMAEFMHEGSVGCIYLAFDILGK